MHELGYYGMKDFVDTYAQGKCKVLDVGSCIVEDGSISYRKLNPDWEYVGCDIQAGENVNIVLTDPYNWTEIEDSEFDIVISGQVFEHIEFPWLTIKEIARVLRLGGFTCIIAPSSFPVHRHPVDTFRYNEDGMVALAKWANLEVVKVDTALWQFNDTLTCSDTRLIARKV
jgi:SAM-dependent methyltransferase